MIFVFDVFGTLIRPNPNRVNPYRRIFDKGIPANVMTRDISLSELVKEVGLSAELPVIEAEAQGDLSGYACYPDTLIHASAASRRGASCGGVHQPVAALWRPGVCPPPNSSH